MIDKKTIAADERLRQEFNQWAEQGRGEEMENHHISIVQQTLARMSACWRCTQGANVPSQRVRQQGIRQKFYGMSR